MRQLPFKNNKLIFLRDVNADKNKFQLYKNKSFINDEGIVKYGLSKKKDKRIITYNGRQTIDLFSSEMS